MDSISHAPTHTHPPVSHLGDATVTGFLHSVSKTHHPRSLHPESWEGQYMPPSFTETKAEFMTVRELFKGESIKMLVKRKWMEKGKRKSEENWSANQGEKWTIFEMEDKMNKSVE